MKNDSVRNMQPFADKMHRFKHEMHRNLDSAYITCHESNHETSCCQEQCPFYRSACVVQQLFKLLGDL